MKCSNCGSLVKRMPSEIRKSKSGNSFCSKSCAAVFNNKKYPKRHRTRRCGVCNELVRSDSKYCSGCYRRKHYLEDKTLAEATANRKDNNRYTSIRQVSRKTYLKSDRPKCCAECGYSNHIEVCHIRDIPDFPPTALVREINDLSNLIALCPNHHWEFDNGLLEVNRLIENK